MNSGRKIYLSDNNSVAGLKAWLSNMTDLGITGIKGNTGLQGNTGTGPQGVTGLALFGETGIQGNTGILGIQGNTGIRGVTGLAPAGTPVSWTGLGDPAVYIPVSGYWVPGYTPIV
jgi:hypothetical protein